MTSGRGPNQTQNESTSSVADSPASLTASPGSVAPAPTAASFGANLPGLFASLDRGEWQSKTSRGFFPQMMDGFSEEFSGTWPRAGLMLSGIAYRRPCLVPASFVTAFSSWAPPRRYTTMTASRRGVSFDPNAKSRGGGGRRLETDLRELGCSGPINPNWAEPFMGFPVGWTDIGPSETPWSLPSPSGSAGES